MYIFHNQRNLHCGYDKVQKTADCSHEGTMLIPGEDNPKGYFRSNGDPEGQRVAACRRIGRQEATEGCGDCIHAEHNSSSRIRHKTKLYGTVELRCGRPGEGHQAEEAGDTTGPGKVYRRYRSANHSHRMQRTSERVQPLDTPLQQNAAFVAAMEDVLEVYSRPYDSRYPVVCMDEQPIELHTDAGETIHLSETNHSEKVDHEYVRKGTCCGFMFTEPLGKWCQVTIRTQRCKQDWAQQIKELVVVANLAALLFADNMYATFEPAEALRIWERLELHHTPKHGSWLDISEIELSAFTKGCLDRRISTIEELQRESIAWYMDRNKRQKGVDWQFSVGDARTRLKHLYPTIKIHV